MVLFIYVFYLVTHAIKSTAVCDINKHLKHNIKIKNTEDDDSVVLSTQKDFRPICHDESNFKNIPF